MFVVVSIKFTRSHRGFWPGLEKILYYGINHKTVKETVSRELRHRLLYIIRKLFSRPIVTSHNILILLKGQFTITKNPSA